MCICLLFGWKLKILWSIIFFRILLIVKSVFVIWKVRKWQQYERYVAWQLSNVLRDSHLVLFVITHSRISSQMSRYLTILSHILQSLTEFYFHQINYIPVNNVEPIHHWHTGKSISCNLATSKAQDFSVVIFKEFPRKWYARSGYAMHISNWGANQTRNLVHVDWNKHWVGRDPSKCELWFYHRPVQVENFCD